MLKKRASNIELLKVIAIILIVIAHNAPEANNVKLRGELEFLFQTNYATGNWQELMVIINFHLAQLAVCVFLVCSAWFLVDSKAINPKKIFRMWVDLIFISVAFATATKIIYPEMTWKTYIRSFLPFSTNANWYISCYLLLYAVHPLLNIIIHGVPKRSLLLFVLGSSVIYCFLIFLIPAGGFYCNQFIEFIVVYFIIAYCKLHLKSLMEDKKLNLIVCIGSFMLLMCEIVGTNYLGLKIGRFSHSLGHWRTFINPIIILCAISLLNLFRTLQFNSRFINYISSCSMLIYIIHENWLIREYVRTDYFRWVYYTFSYDRLLLWCLFLAIISFVASLAITVIYKLAIQKKIYALSDKIYAVFSRYGKKIIDSVLKLN